MGKYKKLIENSGIFFIANFGSKVITFLLVRFYTEYLTTSEYGVADVITTTVSLAIPIITLCITEAVLRFSIDDIENRKKILSFGYSIVLFGNFVFLFAAPILYQFEMFRDNIVMLYLLTVTNGLLSVSVHFCRGIGKTKLFALSGIIHTVFQIGFNILFLLIFNMGIKGYLMASVLGNTFTLFIVFFTGKLYRYLILTADKKYYKQMLTYSVPLVPNSLFWWIMQSSDRYVIAAMLTSADNGLYTVANKIPTIVSSISGIFFQAWQLSSVDEANSKDKDKFYSKVFNLLALILICATSLIMVILQPLYKILVEKSFYSGWRAAPFLLVAMVFSCFSSFLGTNYIAMKKTKGVFFTTIIGAILNIALNIILTPIYGIRGTAFATLASFAVTWIVRIFHTSEFVKINYPVKTFIIPMAIMLIQSVSLSIGVDSILLQAVLFVVIIMIYFKTIVCLIKKIIEGGKTAIFNRK